MQKAAAMPVGRTLEVVEVSTPLMLEQAFAIRHEVFVVGQAVAAEADRDGLDEAAGHLLGRVAGEPAGTLRWRIVEPGLAKIERVAVLERMRGFGLGRAMMVRVLDILRDRDVAVAKLNAQTAVTELYRRLGFEAFGAPFVEEGIPHIAMRLALRTAEESRGSSSGR